MELSISFDLSLAAASWRFLCQREDNSCAKEKTTVKTAYWPIVLWCRQLLVWGVNRKGPLASQELGGRDSVPFDALAGWLPHSRGRESWASVRVGLS
jgi:hypothetical protein